jgi:hypothetical protein
VLISHTHSAPASHTQYYEAMISMFSACTLQTISKLDRELSASSSRNPGQLQVPSTVVNMEAEFLSLGLDIIGLGVFNYDFGSISTESPVIKVKCLMWKLYSGTVRCSPVIKVKGNSAEGWFERCVRETALYVWESINIASVNLIHCWCESHTLLV